MEQPGEVSDSRLTLAKGLNVPRMYNTIKPVWAINLFNLKLHCFAVGTKMFYQCDSLQWCTFHTSHRSQSFMLLMLGVHTHKGYGT